MKKKLMTIIVLALLSNQMQAWSVFGWTSEEIKEEISETMTKMENSFEKIKDKISKSKLFKPATVSSYDKEKEIYFITIELPGYEEENIKIKAKITDKKQQIIVTAEQEKKSVKITKSIPKNVKIKKSSWTYKNGILRIEFPTEKKKIEEIEIKKSK